MKILENNILNKLILDSEEYNEKIIRGGAKNESVNNDGGFPPIYEVVEEIQGDINKREYMSDNSIMNIHNILNNRKNVPFLPMRPRQGVEKSKIKYNNLNLKNKKNNI
jgi:hypothetical protein